MLPTDAQERKEAPIVSGVLDYFPLAIAEVARLSKAANVQHNPGEPMHWDRDKSTDHADCVGRHLMERGTLDEDGMRHTAKVAWRALALLQEELENGTRQDRKSVIDRDASRRSLLSAFASAYGPPPGANAERPKGIYDLDEPRHMRETPASDGSDEDTRGSGGGSEDQAELGTGTTVNYRSHPHQLAKYFTSGWST